MARAHATTADIQVVAPLIATVPQTHVQIAIGMLDQIAQGWPQERPPTLSAEQRTALAAAARGASPELAASFDRVATRWGLPDVFKTP
jgi:hypothetical protein